MIEKSDYDSNNCYKISGNTLDECKSKLYKQYGNDYRIIDRGTILKGGFFGFGQKEYVEVTYVLSQRNSENANKDFNFSKNQEEILRMLHSMFV